MNEAHWEVINRHLPKLNNVITTAVHQAFHDHPELPDHLRTSVTKRVRGQVRSYIAHNLRIRTESQTVDH